MVNYFAKFIKLITTKIYNIFIKLKPNDYLFVEKLSKHDYLFRDAI